METKFLITFTENGFFVTQWVDDKFSAEKIYNEYILDSLKFNVTIEERSDFPPTILV